MCHVVSMFISIIQIDGVEHALLAVSEPAYGNPTLDEATFVWEGRVRTFLLSNIPLGVVTVDELPAFAAVTGGADYSSLGWAMQLFDIDSDGSDELVVSSPLANFETGLVSAYASGGSGGIYCLSMCRCFSSLSQGPLTAALTVVVSGGSLRSFRHRARLRFPWLLQHHAPM